MSSNSLGPSDAFPITKLRKLITLEISENSLGSVGAAHIAKLSALKVLSIASNDLDDESAKHLMKLKALRSLNISDNRIGDRGVGYLASSLANLEELDLSRNKLTHLGIRRLAKLAKLRYLSISYNLIINAEAVVMLLSKLLPKAQGGDPGGSLREINLVGTRLTFTSSEGKWNRVPDKVLWIRDAGKLLCELEKYRSSPLSKEGEAINYLTGHPDATKAEIADAIGVWKSVMSTRGRWKEFNKKWREIHDPQHERRTGAPPKGYVTAAGTVEASSDS